jgi:hypothetical protein
MDGSKLKENWAGSPRGHRRRPEQSGTGPLPILDTGATGEGMGSVWRRDTGVRGAETEMKMVTTAWAVRSEYVLGGFAL